MQISIQVAPGSLRQRGQVRAYPPTDRRGTFAPIMRLRRLRGDQHVCSVQYVTRSRSASWKPKKGKTASYRDAEEGRVRRELAAAWVCGGVGLRRRGLALGGDVGWRRRGLAAAWVGAVGGGVWVGGDVGWRRPAALFNTFV